MTSDVLRALTTRSQAQTRSSPKRGTVIRAPLPPVLLRQQVVRQLLAWHEQEGRHSLPWRQTTVPYRILVSELMLQQTQVPRVIPKYRAFLRRFPTMRSLALAPQRDVLLLWQGLGYNSRAVRLHALARQLHERRAALPQSREELMLLPGIGPYTAGAILIFAHDRPAVSVDVNVARVLRRVFWRANQTPTTGAVDALTLSLLTMSRQPRQWHAAVMDLGSFRCVARAPRCDGCPLFTLCRTKGARADECRTTQSPFAGSVRWWRGQILKQLIRGSVPEAHLMHLIVPAPTPEDMEKYQQARDALTRERVVLTRNKILCIAD